MGLKYYLPLYCPLSKYQFDINQIQKEVDHLSNHWTDVLQSNQELSSNHSDLVKKLYNHYEEISLTSYNGNTKNLATSFSNKQRPAKSKHNEYKTKSSRRFDKPELDERNYDQITSIYKDTYIRKCVESLGGKSARVRLVKLKAKKEVNWHIDYDPSYAVRLVLPIYTNSQVLNFFKKKNQTYQVHIPSNGIPWFLNTGFPHRVVNNGITDRVLLLCSLMDCEELIDYIQNI